jgi:hypothetical protein
LNNTKVGVDILWYFLAGVKKFRSPIHAKKVIHCSFTTAEPINHCLLSIVEHKVINSSMKIQIRVLDEK